MRKIRVALIEDHALTRLGIRTALLQQKGIDIVGESANATQGLRMLTQLQPDIAIVDIGLPDKDGIELTKEVKRATNKKNSGTKVLILTLQDSQDCVLAAFAAGADSYCMKDIHFDNLVAAVRATYKGYTWIDPAIAKIILQQAQKNNHINPKFTTSDAQHPQNHTNLEENSQRNHNFGLTERELEVLQLIADGCNNDNIADRLYIANGTVKTHVRNILGKLGVSDRTQAAVIALRSGIVS